MHDIATAAESERGIGFPCDLPRDSPAHHPVEGRHAFVAADPSPHIDTRSADDVWGPAQGDQRMQDVMYDAMVAKARELDEQQAGRLFAHGYALGAADLAQGRLSLIVRYDEESDLPLSVEVPALGITNRGLGNTLTATVPLSALARLVALAREEQA